VTIVKYARDSTFAEPWAQSIGKFILNFGLLEFESHMWLLQLSDEPQLFPDEWFTQRVARINKLVNRRAFDAAWKDSAERSWERAKTLANTRNQLAHNPLFFGWTDPAEEGTPDLIGILDARSLGDGNSAWKSGISLANIVEKTNEVVTLVEELALLRDEWCIFRDRNLAS
jgi:hypothetical protein